MNSADPIKLVDRIYDATMDDGQWPDLLCQIADACRMENAALVVIDPASSFSSVLSPRSDPQVAEAYNDYWWQHDPTTEIASKSAVGRITTLGDTGKDRFLASAFHNEFWCHSGLGAERLAANLFASNDAFASLVLQPSARRDTISTDAYKTAEFLIPHLARALTISHRFRHQDLELAALNQSLRPDHAGLIVVDQKGHCLHADDAAENLMRGGGVLKLENGAVRLLDDKAGARYEAVLQSLAKSRFGCSSDQPIRLIHGSDKPLLELEIQPFQAGIGNPLGRQAVAKLVFRKRGISRSARLHSLQERFGLTPAEAALAIEMLKGDGRSAAANRCGISINTARTHLTRIFEKTGVNRQAELIRVVIDHER